MNDESTTTPVEPGTETASNTGGENNSARNLMDPTSAILRDKEGDLGRPKGRRKRKISYLTINKIYEIDYKDVALLKRFLNDRGKIQSTRVTGNTAKQQRMIASAIRRAREMALLPFVVTEPVPDRPMRPRSGGRYDRDNRGDRGERDRSERMVPENEPAPAAE